MAEKTKSAFDLLADEEIEQIVKFVEKGDMVRLNRTTKRLYRLTIRELYAEINFLGQSSLQRHAQLHQTVQERPTLCRYVRSVQWHIICMFDIEDIGIFCSRESFKNPDEDPLWSFDQNEYKLSSARQDAKMMHNIVLAILQRFKWLQHLSVAYSADYEYIAPEDHLYPSATELQMLDFPVLETFDLRVGGAQVLDGSGWQGLLKGKLLTAIDLDTLPTGLLSPEVVTPSVTSLLLHLDHAGQDFNLDWLQYLAKTAPSLEHLHLSTPAKVVLPLWILLLMRSEDNCLSAGLPVFHRLQSISLQGVAVIWEEKDFGASDIWRLFFECFPNLVQLNLGFKMWHEAVMEALTDNLLNPPVASTLQEIDIGTMIGEDLQWATSLTQLPAIQSIRCSFLVQSSLPDGSIDTTPEGIAQREARLVPLRQLLDQSFADSLRPDMFFKVKFTDTKHASMAFEKIIVVGGQITSIDPMEESRKREASMLDGLKDIDLKGLGQSCKQS